MYVFHACVYTGALMNFCQDHISSFCRADLESNLGRCLLFSPTLKLNFLRCYLFLIRAVTSSQWQCTLHENNNCVQSSCLKVCGPQLVLSEVCFQSEHVMLWQYPHSYDLMRHIDDWSLYTRGKCVSLESALMGKKQMQHVLMWLVVFGLILFSHENPLDYSHSLSSPTSSSAHPLPHISDLSDGVCDF